MSLEALSGDTARVVTWEADVAAFLAAVAAADGYVGYDSAGQHIAAALGVPTLSLFIRSAGRRHAERWTPRGSAPVRVVRSRSPANPVALFDAARQGLQALIDTPVVGNEVIDVSTR
jgi:ADP-heptose:LPS heptosyltransferase